MEKKNEQIMGENNLHILYTDKHKSIYRIGSDSFAKRMSLYKSSAYVGETIRLLNV